MTEIKKIGDDRHGNIFAVFLSGEKVGEVKKWHGLFVANGHQPVKTRKEAVQQVVDFHEFGQE